MVAEKVAVVTGSSKGIGFETARVLASRGYRVVVTARQQDSAAAAADQIEGLTHAHALDVSSDVSVAAFFEWLWAELGRIDVLVNNAGRVYGGYDTTLLNVSMDVMREAFDNNSLSALRMIQYALPKMNEAGFGRIVNVSSGMGSLNDMGGGAVAYRVSKTAMNSVTSVAAIEARGDVKINAVCPGWVRTDMGGPSATRSVEHGADGVVWAATLPSSGPSGGFFRDGELIAW